MSNTDQTTQRTKAPVADAEARAHAHITENAGPSWRTIDKEQLRRLQARGYRPGAQPGQSYRPKSQGAKPAD